MNTFYKKGELLVYKNSKPDVACPKMMIIAL